MTIRFELKKIAAVGLFLIVGSFCLLMYGSHPVAAVPGQGPDSTPITVHGAAGPGIASYAVSDDLNLTDVTHTYIKIYSTTASTTIQLHGGDMCTSTASGARLGTTNNFDQVVGLYYPSPPSYVNNTPTTDFTFYKYQLGVQQQVGSALNGNWNSSISCKDLVASIALSGATKDPATGMYVYSLTAQVDQLAPYATHFLNLFSLSGPTNVYFSQDTGNSATPDPQDFGYQLSSPIPSEGQSPTGYKTSANDVFYDTGLPFGSDCTVVNNTTVHQFTFYDVDSGNSVVQPTVISAKVYDATLGKYVPIKYSAGSTPIVPTAGVVTQNITGGNKQLVYLNFIPQIAHKYILELSGIYYNNTLQFTLPFGSIYYYTTCQSLNSDIQGATTLDRQTVVPGQSANWTHQMINQSIAGTASNVTAIIHRQITTASGAVTSSSTSLISAATMPPNSKDPSPPKGTTFAASGGDVGSKICEWITWTSNSGTGTNQSAAYCVTVGKWPNIQIWGGDLRTAGDVDTSTTKIINGPNTSYYGSWVEYGALINGTNQGSRFGSSSSLANGPSALGAYGTNPLTFANNNTPQAFGKYDPGSPVLNSLYDMMKKNQLGIAPGSGSFTGNISSLSGNYNLTSDVTITGGTIPLGKTIAINDPGHVVTITGNISYSGNPSSIGDIPQVIIVASTINVKDSVTNVDAWLLADTMIDTCYNQVKVSFTVCGSPLQVNGPLTSNKAKFKRTAGSESTNPGASAETINFRSDAYLWEYAQASKNVTPTVVQVTQAPPRY